MTYKKFSEYLSQNGKLQTSGKVSKIADFEGSVDTKPAKEIKHKDAGGKGQEGDIKPYKGGTDAKDPNKGKLEDGFASKGDSKLKYVPKIDDPSKEGGTKKVTWPTTKTQEWIERTKNLSLAEFTKRIRSENMEGLDECACQDTPYNSIKETISICKCNPKHISSLVREMKRNNLFAPLMKEMAEHNETFKALAVLMEDDEIYARKLAKALNEMVAPPIGADAMPMPKKKPPMGMGDEGMEDMGDEDMEDNMEDDMGDEDELDDEGMEDDMGDEGMDDMGDEDELDDEGMEDDMGDEGMEEPVPPKNKAHQNLINAMKNQPALMRSI